MVHALLALIALQQPVDSVYTTKIRELAGGAKGKPTGSGGARRGAVDFINQTVDEMTTCRLS